jgi:hypothetical protein
MKRDLMETGLEGFDWIYLSQDRDKLLDLVNTVIDLGVQ